MGSPITFSGFNKIDFGVVLNAIMQQERAPIAAIEAQRTTLQAQDSAFGTFATRLAAVEEAVEDLADSNALSGVSATTSDATAVGISTASATATGSYEVVVSELARAQVLVTNTTYGSTDVVATGGVIGLAKFGDPPISVAITGSMTLEDIAEAINNDPNAPVSASVVQVTPGQYRLVLTGRQTGADNAFTVEFSTALTGGVGLNFTDTDQNGIFGDSDLDNTQLANDAELTVNKVAIKSASNNVEGAIPGVTLHLQKTSAAPVTVAVTKDHKAAIDQVEAFATVYNDLVKFMSDQSAASANGKPAIGRDSLLRGLRDALRSTIMGEEEDGGTWSRLAQVGIHFDGSGKIAVDSAQLSAALESSPGDVRKLFGGTSGDGGRFGSLKNLIAEYTEAGGLLSDVRDRIDAQVSQMGNRINSLESQLALRRASLQREFIAADRAMTQLEAQGSSLTQLMGQYRLF